MYFSEIILSFPPPVVDGIGNGVGGRTAQEKDRFVMNRGCGLAGIISHPVKPEVCIHWLPDGEVLTIT